jgi:hypothetical protein
MLNPFKKWKKRSDEPVEMKLVKHRSHEPYTFHIPVGPDFDRRDVLPAD